MKPVPVDLHSELTLLLHSTTDPSKANHRQSSQGVGARQVGQFSMQEIDVFGSDAGVTRARCLLFGANTPWNRVRLTLGLGTRAASLAMKSTGSKITWVGRQ
jgi:hypothetical protein